MRAVGGLALVGSRVCAPWFLARTPTMHIVGVPSPRRLFLTRHLCSFPTCLFPPSAPCLRSLLGVCLPRPLAVCLPDFFFWVRARGCLCSPDGDHLPLRSPCRPPRARRVFAVTLWFAIYYRSAVGQPEVTGKTPTSFCLRVRSCDRIWLFKKKRHCLQVRLAASRCHGHSDRIWWYKNTSTRLHMSARALLNHCQARIAQRPYGWGWPRGDPCPRGSGPNLTGTYQSSGLPLPWPLPGCLQETMRSPSAGSQHNRVSRPTRRQTRLRRPLPRGGAPAIWFRTSTGGKPACSE